MLNCSQINFHHIPPYQQAQAARGAAQLAALLSQAL
jgi:hypothetical protein